MRRREALIGGGAAAVLGLSAQAQEEAEAIAEEALDVLAAREDAQPAGDEAAPAPEMDAAEEAARAAEEVDLADDPGPAIDDAVEPTAEQLADMWRPTTVEVRADMPAGEIHVDPNIFMLYLTLGNGVAIRYGVGVGRPGLYEAGEFYVGAKKEWPSWTPTPDMIRRDPAKYGRWRDGMPGGVNNPLGARAIYLFQPGIGDTFLRIHGTNEPGTIGQEVSNGCARLTNNYVMDLYPRVEMESRVILYPKIA